tara:strand:+ start:308 stop:478 length:171 start_codon:yes stop_codon:yes gene_type:complete
MPIIADIVDVINAAIVKIIDSNINYFSKEIQFSTIGLMPLIINWTARTISISPIIL